MAVDIALSINRTLQVPLLVTINSIIQNTTFAAGQPPLRFNIVVPVGDRTFFSDKLAAAFADYPSEQVSFRIAEFTPPDFLKHYLDTKFQEKKPERRISRYMQYARLYLKKIFPDVERMLYFDADIIVLDDVRSLHALGNQLTEQSNLAAVPQFFPAIFYFSNPFKVWSDLRKFKSTFNSGVLIMELRYWNEQTFDLIKRYLDLDAQNNYRLYHLGDETVFNIPFKDTYTQLPKQWNCCGYGQTPLIARILSKDPQQMKVIHWSGGYQKPWKSDRVIYSDLWRSYLPATS